MANNLPLVHFLRLPGRAEPDALLGFSLPFLPDMLTSHWFTGSDERERLSQALQLQIRLIHAFWSTDIAAWDLRFVGTDELPGVLVGVLCRLRRPAQVQARQLHEHCLTRAQQIQQLFADSGYELVPLFDELSLGRYLNPFRFQSVAEVRRKEEVRSILVNTYQEYEFYVTYPWHWTIQNRLRLFDALLKRQSNCLVSVCLEPTRLSPQEQAHLNHATSMQVADLLLSAGPHGETTYNIYKDYAHSLRQPYLLRIGLAAANPQTLEQVGRRFIDELAPQALDHFGRSMLNQATGPILEYPQSQQEWHGACHSLFNLEWIPWGQNRGMDLPGTARLRYLVDDQAASMAFRLPVAHVGDIPGVPVRSLVPSIGKPPVPGTIRDDNSSTASIVPFAGSITLPTTSLLPSSIQKPEDLPGKTLGTCQIEALLGQGGFGAVFRARQVHLQRLVAVKVVLTVLSHADRDEQRKMLLRFDREAQAVARLDHPHILTLYEYQHDPLPYIVMPYVAGGSLADEIKSSGYRPLPINGVVTILSQVASALDYTQQQRLVHRDIKPHNLLRHADGRILLSDFGIVQFEDEALTGLTSGKNSPYTAAYASPEQLLGQKVDYRSDIYSLGVVMYELLCGQCPFQHAIGHIQSSPPSMQTLGVQVHPTVEAVVFKALAKQPELRHQSAGEMAAEFQRAVKYQ